MTPRGVRVAVFTSLPDIMSTEWWPVVTSIPELGTILLVQHERSRRIADVLRRFRANVRKHGPLFVPYRAAALVGSVCARILDGHAPYVARSAPCAVEEITATNIHDSAVLEQVRQWAPDLGLSIGAPILKPALFAIPPLGTVNVHLGKVPDFRGAPPGFWELWTGATEVGATVHWVEAGLDTGAVIASAVAPIYRRDTLSRVEGRAAELGRRLLSESLARVVAGGRPGSPQAAGGHTYRAPTILQRFALWRRCALRRVYDRLADPQSLVKLGVARVWLAAWRPLRDVVRTALGRHPVRVFTFHRVTELCRDGMTVTPQTFTRQIDFVRRHHTVVGLDRALELLAPGQRLRRPVAALTFDDAYGSVGRVAAPLMRDRGLPGTCFVCTDFPGTTRRFEHDAMSPVGTALDVMDWNALAELRRSGWHIGAHTATHARLSRLDGAALKHELSAPIATLHERAPSSALVLAYPFGGRDDITTDGVLAAKEAGYSALVSNFGGENVPGDDPFSTRRIDLGGDHDAVMWQAAALGLDLSKWKRRLGREERSPGSQPASSKRSAERRGIRVTHIVFDLDGGGMEALVAAMAARWRDADVRLSIVTLSGRIGRVGRTVQSLVEQFQVPRITPGVSLISPSAIVRALRATRADVVHLHTGAWLKGAYAAALAGVGRVIYTEHGREHHDPLTARLQDKIALQLTDSVVAVSERLRTYMIREIGVRPSRAHTIPNGVDTAVFAPSAASAPLRASLRIPDDALVLGSVGRLEPVKGYVRLVEVYARLRTMGIPRPLVLVLFGEGGDRAAIEREAERLGVRDGIRMPGWTERSAEAHRLFDVFAMTSHSEGMSVSLMEAMACGVCPVVTDVGSNAEVVGDRLRSHVVAGNDIDAFASVVADLLRSDQRRHDAGRTARAHAVAHHSFDRMMEAYEKLYRGEPVPSEALPHAAIATA